MERHKLINQHQFTWNTNKMPHTTYGARHILVTETFPNRDGGPNSTIQYDSADSFTALAYQSA